MVKTRRTKYNFSALEVGKSFECEALDVNSMQSSLSRFNKAHGLTIKTQIKVLSKSKVLVTRVS